MSHDRTRFHSGVDLDTVLELAEALPGMDETEIHEVLEEFEARLAQLENAPHFSLNAVIA